MSQKGFLFIEGSVMILVAGIGILSAALFPSMTSYLVRSRDAARTAHIKDISTAIGAYYADKESYPIGNGGCVPKLSTSYRPSGVPTDPISGRLSGYCDGSDGMTYGYSLYAAGYYTGFYLVADMESPRGGNAATLPPQDSTELKSYLDNLSRGSGPYYILSN